MAYSATIKMVMEDDLPAIGYQIRDKNSAAVGKVLDPRDSDTWKPLDITGATIIVDVRAKGGSEVIETLNLTILDPTIGTVLLSIVDAIFVNTAGDYELETVVTITGLQQTVYDYMLIKLRSRIKVSS
jgi:hypothetical protein